MQNKVDAAYVFSLMCSQFSPKQTAKRAVEEQVMDNFHDFMLDMEQRKVAPASYDHDDKEPGNEFDKLEGAICPVDLFGKVDLTPARVMG